MEVWFGVILTYVKVSEENREKQQRLIEDPMAGNRIGTPKTEMQRGIWVCLHVQHLLINTEQLAKIHNASVT